MYFCSSFGPFASQSDRSSRYFHSLAMRAMIRNLLVRWFREEIESYYCYCTNNRLLLLLSSFFVVPLRTVYFFLFLYKNRYDFFASATSTTHEGLCDDKTIGMKHVAVRDSGKDSTWRPSKNNVFPRPKNWKPASKPPIPHTLQE